MRTIIGILILLVAHLGLCAQQPAQWTQAADAFLETQRDVNLSYDGLNRLEQLFVSLPTDASSDDYFFYLSTIWAAELDEVPADPAAICRRAHSLRDSVWKAALILEQAGQTRYNTDHAEQKLVCVGTALAILQKAKLDSSLLYIQSLCDYAYALAAAGKPLDQSQVLFQALALAEKTVGPSHPIYAEVLGELAYYYTGIGQPDQASQFEQQAQMAARRDPQPIQMLENAWMDEVSLIHQVSFPDVVRKAWLFRYGSVMGGAGVWSTYRKWLAVQVYNDWVSRFDKNKPWRVPDLQVLLRKGLLELNNGLREEALKTLLFAQQQIEKMRTAKPSAEVEQVYYTAVNLLGCVQFSRGHFAEAAKWFEEEFNYYQKNKSRFDEGTLWVNYNLILSLASLHGADKLKAHIAFELNRHEAIRASTSGRMELYADYFLQVLHDPQSAYRLYDNLYYFYWEEAERTAQRESSGSLPPGMRQSDKSTQVLDIGPESVSWALYEDRHKPQGDEYLHLLDKIATTALLAGKPNEASRYALKYINEYYTRAAWKAQFRRMNANLREIYELKQRLFPKYDLLLEAVMRDSTVTADLHKIAFALTLDSKANLQLYYRHLQAALETSADTVLKKKYQQYLSLQRAYGIQKAKNASAEGLGVLKLQLDTLQQALSRKTALVSSPFEKFVFWQQVKDSLKSGEAAVEIKRFKTLAEGKVIYAAMIITPQDTMPKIVFLKNGEYLEGRGLKKYRNSIEVRMEDETSYRDYWQPIQQHLNGIKKVFVSPDGAYSQMNLHTLLNPATRRYLIDDLSVYQVISTKELPTQHDVRSHVKKVMLMGRPAYFLNESTTNHFTSKEEEPQRALTRAQIAERTISDLPATEEEIKSIANTLKKSKVTAEIFLGAEATEDHFKKSTADVVHIATHGFWFKEDERVPEAEAMFNSGLLLAGVKNQVQDPSSEDGLLTAYEVQGMNLDGVQLAVLSACETALGEVEAGEGVYGLQRAFSIAGVDKMIMSLWKVDDQVTRLLFESFYTQWLIRKNSIDKAFYLAQQEIKSRYPDPYYWGAFILID